MADESKALILKMRPKIFELRDERIYTEVQVKDLLFAFARDLGITWPDGELNDFIETAFDFD